MDESSPSSSGPDWTKIRQAIEALSTHSCPPSPAGCTWLGMWIDAEGHCHCLYDCPEGTWITDCI